MFGNLGLHVIKFPSGKFGYVGSIPIDLATMVPATTSDVMGGRASRDETGKLVAPKFPAFDTESEAIEFALSKGFTAEI